MHLLPLIFLGDLFNSGFLGGDDAEGFSPSQTTIPPQQRLHERNTGNSDL